MLSSHADTSHINHDFGWRGRGKKEKKEGWGEEEEEQGGRSLPSICSSSFAPAVTAARRRLAVTLKAMCVGEFANSSYT